MELAGVFRRMVGPRPWKGPLIPLWVMAALTAPVTDVKAAAKPHRPPLDAHVLTWATCACHGCHAVRCSDGYSTYERSRWAGVGIASDAEWKAGRTFVVGVCFGADDLDLDLGLEEVDGALSESRHESCDGARL